MGEGSVQRDADGGDVSVSSHFGNEASAGLERVGDTTEKGGLIVNPMEGGVGKYGIEMAVERELSGVDDLRCDAAIAGGFDHLRRCIHA